MRFFSYSATSALTIGFNKFWLGFIYSEKGTITTPSEEPTAFTLEEGPSTEKPATAILSCHLLNPAKTIQPCIVSTRRRLLLITDFYGGKRSK